MGGNVRGFFGFFRKRNWETRGNIHFSAGLFLLGLHVSGSGACQKKTGEKQQKEPASDRRLG